MLLAAWVYAPALGNGFSLDDYNWLERALGAGTDRGSIGEGWSFVFSREPGQLLNPFPRAIFLVWVRLFGISALPFHLVILLLHLVNVGLVAILGSRLSGPLCGLLASSLFAVLPAFHEAIFWVAAFFHPLVTTLYLCALLGFLAARGGSRGGAVLCLVALTLALLTKAFAFALLPTLLVYLYLRRASLDAASRRLCWAALLVGALVAGLNLVLGVRDSYLIERGYYALGGHWPGNLWAYFGRLGFPFPLVTQELSLATKQGPGASRLLAHLGATVLTGVVAATLLRGDWRSRWWAAQLLLCLLPTLPFVFAPASRYLYLAAVPFTLLIASLVAPRLESLWAAREDRRSRPAVTVALLTLLIGYLLGSWAEVRLVDNHYEYRERQMSEWVEQVASLLPPEGASELTVVGLPALAIDRGIHFEAALRLRWSRSDFVLRAVDDLTQVGSATQGHVLVFDGTDFRRPPR